ncbi:hypothetical protein E7T09_02970 [Deinococcus sp. KSM4-11]|uniref:hypothetical protein n=1 Tax=Deinococcus sp. KSM4-11 TaxID=2568654 RepID=UPI0010A50838|nr:hypothetical protein [Deinococcus sp. KSM4-11]THF88189.1 hypothetical protein E7T09_02970 [Deinococcus sp. KSM4-11]
MSLNPDGFLATQDLKDRGWTPALIARFLGEHDRTRPNGLKMGRRRLPPVKLYVEARVLDVERLDDFLAAQARAADARERSERSRAERRAKRQRQIEEAALSYAPTIQPEPLRTGAVRKARDPYLPTLETVFEHHSTRIGKLTQTEQDDLKTLLRARLDDALNAVYPWYPVPGRSNEARPPASSTSAAKASDWREWDWE